MAYEFKKLSDVNILEEKKTGLNVLVEDAGEIVKINNDDLNPHNVYMVVDTTYHYGKENGYISPYFQDPISTVVNNFRGAGNKTILVRGILSDSGITMYNSIGSKIEQAEDGSFDAIVYYNDLHPLYLSSSNNAITLLEGWEEPAPSIPAPATASVGQTIVVKTVDENSKPTEWEANTSMRKIELNDMSAMQAGLITCDSETAASIVMAFRTRIYQYPIVERVVSRPGNAEGRLNVCLKSFNVYSVDDDYAVRLHFGDEYADIIVNAADNTITLDPDWVAPAEPIPTPATAEVGQVITVKAVDENGKPTEWETVGIEKYQAIFVDNSGTYICPSHTFEEISNIFNKSPNRLTAMLRITPNIGGVPHIIMSSSVEIRRVVNMSDSTSCYWFAFIDYTDDSIIRLQLNADNTVTEIT